MTPSFAIIVFPASANACVCCVLFYWGFDMYKSIAILVLILGIIATPAEAVVPEDGWWIEEDQPGRGWNIEIQGDIFGIASFLFDQQGRDIWWISAGNYNFSGSRYNGTFNAFEGGQCQACPWTPSVNMGPEGGPVTISFDSPTSGTIQWQGETISIIRHEFGYGEPLDKILGAWSFNAQIIPGVNDGDFINYSALVNSGSDRGAAGERVGDAGSTAVAIWDAENQVFAFLLQDSTDFSKFWVAVPAATRYLAGQFWLLEGDEEPSGDGSTFFASRLGPSGAFSDLASSDIDATATEGHRLADNPRSDVATAFEKRPGADAVGDLSIGGKTMTRSRVRLYYLRLRAHQSSEPEPR